MDLEINEADGMPVNLDDYQEWCRTTESGTVVDMSHQMRLLYFAVGLTGEAGEAAEKIKKLVRDNEGRILTWEQFHLIRKELGDVLWYLSQLCNECSIDSPGDFTVKDCFRVNREKLTARLASGTIQGSGDSR